MRGSRSDLKILKMIPRWSLPLLDETSKGMVFSGTRWKQVMVTYEGKNLG